ncbi:MAG TPA: kelch repeat-containing protein [Planctomycetota bacterium]|nr:kelch repeat-containing protein [Planctomycetota bacterium]
MRHLRGLASLLATTLPLFAQGDFDLDKVTSGTLGGTLTLQVANAAPSFPLLWMVSQTAGPTPVALLDPLDPRSVAVGLDLLGNWGLQLTSPTGGAVYSVGLPNDAAFNGYVFHWQAATFPGATTFLDGIANAATTHHGQASTSAALPNALLAPRAAATLCWARNRNAGQGDFLLVSGASTEFFQFRTLDSAAGPAMNTPRALYASATLNDGRVLFAGGVDGSGAVTSSCEIYDPIANTFTAVASLLGPRAGHAAATLADGRVMVAGGTTNFTDLTTAITAALNTVEIYNPVTNTWTAGPNIGGNRLVPALTRLNTGRIMISGGIEVTLFLGIPLALTSTNKVQLYNPATNTWSNGANMPIGRAYHHDSQVTLADGRVLLTGGVLVPDLLNAANAASIANADLYNPATNTWAAGTMSHARTGHSATRLANGNVIVCGGAEGLLSAAVTLDAVARFDPTTNTWTDLAPMTTARLGHTAAALPDGLLVILGPDASGEALHF